MLFPSNPSIAKRGGAVDRLTLSSSARRTRQKTQQLLNDLFWLSQFALPNHNRAPAHFLDLQQIIRIAPHVSLEFGVPKTTVRFRRGRISTVGMAMPETAVDPHNLFSSWQHDIRRSGQISSMQSVAEPHGRKHFANGDFRTGVLATNASHQRAAGLWAQSVHVILRSFRSRTRYSRRSFPREPLSPHDGRPPYKAMALPPLLYELRYRGRTAGWRQGGRDRRGYRPSPTLAVWEHH